jgi:murein DD-endopeptidase MepM/ murein hydrolase activator NlpD
MPPAERSLLIPVSPLSVNQPFGVNAAYYGKFVDAAGNPEKGHPGMDLKAVHGQPVYAAHDGDAIYIKDAHGGEGVWIFGNGFATIYWHLIGDTDPAYALPIPFDGKRHPVKAGDLIGYADNTGAPFESSGDHLHFGLILIDQYGTIMNQGNGYSGCIDPQPYLSDKFAHEDQVEVIKQQALALAQAVSNIKPTDPNAPQETSLASRIIALIEEELGEANLVLNHTE